MKTIRTGAAVVGIATAFVTGVVLSAIVVPQFSNKQVSTTHQELDLAAALPKQTSLEPEITGTIEELVVTGAGPIWTNANGLTEAGSYLLDQIRLIEFDGLNPERYHLTELNQLGTEGWEAGSQDKFEKVLTASYKQLIMDLGQGVLKPSAAQRSWFQEPVEIDARAEFEALVENPQNIKESLDRFRPSMNVYKQMSYALSNYRIIEHNGGWPLVPAGSVLKPGDIDKRIPILVERLTISQDYPAQSLTKRQQDNNAYSNDVVDAVRVFQRRHGLVDDGIIGRATLEAINVTAKRKVEILEANLERLRWLPKQLGKRHVITNIADYSLRVFNEGKEILSMPIVSGKPKFKTPVFSDTMEYLVINPTWTVPRSITYRELLPNERKQPGYLANRNYELLREERGRIVSYNPNQITQEELYSTRFPYTIRQKPGKGNALGKVKFIFPNKYSIYLHDTPAKSLFKKNRRAFSHGCVRLGNPQELATTLLKYEGWSEKQVRQAFSKKNTQRISLKEPVENHIIYLTSWVDNGLVQFREDVYGHDDDLIVALRNPAKARWPASLFASLDDE